MTSHDNVCLSIWKNLLYLSYSLPILNEMRITNLFNKKDLCNVLFYNVLIFKNKFYRVRIFCKSFNED